MRCSPRATDFGRLDLDDQVDGAHVDPELEARCRDEARDAPRFQILLDEHALFARERAVVGARELALGELVQTQREPFGETAVVDEDDRRPVRLDEPEDLGVDRRPDGAGAVLGADVHLDAVGQHWLRERRRRPELAQVLDRDDNLEIELLARAGVDELDLAAARDEAPDLVERPLCRREADALDRSRDQRVEALDADREVRPALRPGDGVHLVEDQRLDADERLTRLGRQHQIERLGGRDQDVGRLLQQLAPFALRRVARAHGHAHLRADPGEWAAEVALDVVVQRLERRDVEHAQSFAGRRGQPVERVEERRQRLSGACGCLDQHVLAGGDRRPAEYLGRRRSVERLLEPAPRRLRENVERAHRVSVPGGYFVR